MTHTTMTMLAIERAQTMTMTMPEQSLPGQQTMKERKMAQDADVSRALGVFFIIILTFFAVLML